jgi:precorrin-8X/cobalt-precorrin-8 methylmutase
MADLADLLSDFVARDRTALVGFDFAFGYPAGFAAWLCPQCPDWRGVWRTLAARLRDGEDNANNRFEAAAALNRQLSVRAFPFWGCPPGQGHAFLSSTRPEGFCRPDAGGAGEEGCLAEYRLTDRAAAGPHSIWKLAYPGSVGSQTLLGIAHLDALRRHPWFDGRVRVWPFETGLQLLTRPAAGEWRLLLAEVYPSMLEVAAEPGEVKDRAQVRTVVRHFSALDTDGRLAPLFAGPPGLTADERAAVECEEAWILGIETSARARRRAVEADAEAGDDGTATVARAVPSSRYHYVREPDEIYRRSFAIIREEVDLSRLEEAARAVAVRIVHACGDPSVLADLVAAPGAAAAARAALATGAPILVDAEMLAAGIIRRRLPAANPIICTLAEPAVAAAARAAGTTRSAAAVDRWLPHLGGAVVAIGNAPTALFHLLECLDQGAPAPAAILGFPVGFVGAAEAKEALITHPAGVPFITLRGRRGGSAMAAAAVNAIAGEPSADGR